MGRRVTVELLHIAVGLIAAAAIAGAAAWAYPLGRDVIWMCGGVAMAVTMAMGIGPLRRARRADRAAGGDAPAAGLRRGAPGA